MDFRVEELKQTIHGNDTTQNRYIREDFRLIVRDSTSKGYKLEYSSLGNREMEGDEIDFLNKTVLEKVAELSDKQHVIFTLSMNWATCSISKTGAISRRRCKKAIRLFATVSMQILLSWIL